MIRLNRVYKDYSSLKVFEDFSLEIEEGKITCVLGESGSGKTTLLNMIANLTKYQGEIEREDCSYVFQKPNLFPNMTVMQNLLLVNKDQEKVNALLNKFGLAEKINAYPNHLSGGQAQRVALCRGLLYEKPVLLLDEPFSNLDIGLKMLALNIVKKEHIERNNTVVMVTHDIKDAVLIADRIVVIKQGKVIKDISQIDEKTEKEIFSLLAKDVNLDV